MASSLSYTSSSEVAKRTKEKPSTEVENPIVSIENGASSETVESTSEVNRNHLLNSNINAYILLPTFGLPTSFKKLVLPTKVVTLFPSALIIVSILINAACYVIAIGDFAVVLSSFFQLDNRVVGKVNHEFLIVYMVVFLAIPFVIQACIDEWLRIHGYYFSKELYRAIKIGEMEMNDSVSANKLINIRTDIANVEKVFFEYIPNLIFEKVMILALVVHAFVLHLYFGLYLLGTTIVYFVGLVLCIYTMKGHTKELELNSKTYTEWKMHLSSANKWNNFYVGLSKIIDLALTVPGALIFGFYMGSESDSCWYFCNCIAYIYFLKKFVSTYLRISESSCNVESLLTTISEYNVKFNPLTIKEHKKLKKGILVCHKNNNLYYIISVIIVVGSAVLVFTLVDFCDPVIDVECYRKKEFGEDSEYSCGEPLQISQKFDYRKSLCKMKETPIEIITECALKCDRSVMNVYFRPNRREQSTNANMRTMSYHIKSINNVEDKEVEDKEERNRRLQQNSQRPCQSSDKIDVFAFSGGGLKAVAKHSAVLAELLGLCDETVKEFYDSRVITLGGNSGGSWFVTLTNYSEKFQNFMETGVLPVQFFEDSYQRFLEQNKIFNFGLVPYKVLIKDDWKTLVNDTILFYDKFSEYTIGGNAISSAQVAFGATISPNDNREFMGYGKPQNNQGGLPVVFACKKLECKTPYMKEMKDKFEEATTNPNQNLRDINAASSAAVGFVDYANQDAETIFHKLHVESKHKVINSVIGFFHKVVAKPVSSLAGHVLGTAIKHFAPKSVDFKIWDKDHNDSSNFHFRDGGFYDNSGAVFGLHAFCSANSTKCNPEESAKTPIKLVISDAGDRGSNTLLAESIGYLFGVKKDGKCDSQFNISDLNIFCYMPQIFSCADYTEVLQSKVYGNVVLYSAQLKTVENRFFNIPKDITVDLRVISNNFQISSYWTTKNMHPSEYIDCMKHAKDSLEQINGGAVGDHDTFKEFIFDTPKFNTFNTKLKVTFGSMSDSPDEEVILVKNVKKH